MNFGIFAFLEYFVRTVKLSTVKLHRQTTALINKLGLLVVLLITTRLNFVERFECNPYFHYTFTPTDRFLGMYLFKISVEFWQFQAHSW